MSCFDVPCSWVGTKLLEQNYVPRLFCAVGETSVFKLLFPELRNTYLRILIFCLCLSLWLKKPFKAKDRTIPLQHHLQGSPLMNVVLFGSHHL